MNRERAKLLIEEARVVAEQDLTSSVEMLEKAYLMAPDQELHNEILLRKDALKKLDQARDRFWSKYSEDKLYSAYQILLGLPENYRFDQEEEILHTLQDKFTRAEALIKEAKAQSATEYQLALEKFNQASVLMPDFPGLAADISTFERTVEQGNAYLVAITKAIEKGELGKATGLLKRYRQGYGDDDNAGLLEQQISRRRVDMGRSLSIRRILVAIFLILSAIFVLAGILVFNDARNLDAAERLWSEVRELRVAGRFVAASSKSEEIEKRLRHVYLLDLSRRGVLLSQARRFLKSQHRREGLAGRILVDGGYVAQGMTAAARELEKVEISAEEDLSLGDPETAAGKYVVAMDLARKIKASPARLKTIAAALKRARVEFLDARIKRVGTEFGPGQADAALGAYRQIQQEIDAYGLSASAVAGRLSQAFNRTAVARLKAMEATATRAFAGGDFDTAVRVSQEALAFAAANSIDDAARIKRIRVRLGRALVSGILARARSLQRDGAMIEALGAYRQALKVAAAHDVTAYEPLAAAEKAVVDIPLILDRQYLDKGIVDVRAALDRGDITAAASRLRDVDERLAASEFADNPALDSQVRNIASLGQALKDQTQVREYKNYLRENYAGIIRKAFTMGKDAALLNPEIIMLREDDEKLVFSISAYSYVKKGETGNYIVYHLNYALNRGDGSWKVESQAQEQRRQSDNRF